MERKTKDRSVKHPEPIGVGISQAGYVRVAQEDKERMVSRDGEVVIIIHPDDVDQIVEWLQEAKAEILEAETNRER